MNKIQPDYVAPKWGEESKSMNELEYLLPVKDQAESKEINELQFNSDDEGQEIIKSNGTNPFTLDLIESKEKAEYNSEEKVNYDPSQAEHKMNAFLSRLQSHMAVPDYALTDAVFSVDKPKCSISLGEKLPLIDLSEHCQEDAVIQISVTEVYSPFQFWFQLSHNSNTLNVLSNNLYNFYNQLNRDMEIYLLRLPNYFIQPGYICAARHGVNGYWRRARIVSQPLSDNEKVSIYYVDYGSGGEVPRTDLRFLSRNFAVLPPLAIRGCLSYIHPLGSHWSWESIQEFKRIVLDHDVYANVTECDLNDSVVYMRLSNNKDIKPSFNRLMVDCDLAGKSDHYSKRMIKFNCGRRLRYLRERLPSFDMLETRVFPIGNEDFDNDFDSLICAPSFYEHYEVPNLKNPFLWNLQEALEAWMVTFKKDEEIWKKIYREANQKLKEDY